MCDHKDYYTLPNDYIWKDIDMKPIEEKEYKVSKKGLDMYKEDH